MATIRDIVLIYYENQPFSFARIEEILPDAKRDWYHVKLLLLQLPLQTVTWILKNAYINGEEFTMGGNRMRLELVESPEGAKPEDPGPETKPGDAKVVSLRDRKSKKPVP